MELTDYFPDLTTDRLIMRQLAPGDAGFLLRHFSDPEVTRYLYDAEPLKEIGEAEEIINWYGDPRGKDHNRWVILRKDGGEAIGTCGFHCWDRKNNIAEIGYDLGRDFRGRGYMTEAVSAALKNGFARMGLNRIQAFIFPGNEGSVKLAERCGFQREGIIRDKHFYRGYYYDHYCYSILQKEWLERIGQDRIG